MLFSQPVVCVDVETTGASPQHDRITEIGIVEMHPDGRLVEWSTLVNPLMRIPEFIERLTGISNAMVATAPTFEAVAAELAERLHGRLFVAHNARFDYAFIKNAFRRLDIAFRADTLCTVRLSRRLYPQHFKHNLDSLISRMGLDGGDRHRALADARVLAQFLQKLPEDHDNTTLLDAIRYVTKRPALPPNIPEAMLDEVPEGPGVYLFYGDNDMPLYVGKSINLRERVMSHFSGDHASTKALRLSQQLKRIECRETAGELGALLLEARLVKTLQPIHNQRLRRENDLCTWQLAESEQGSKRLVLRRAEEIDFGRTQHLYGTFTSPRQATEALRRLADAHRMCLVQLGLEKRVRGKATPCFAYQLKKCLGVCAGKESPIQHDLRLLQALAAMKIKSWPWLGPVAIRERQSEREDLHVVDHWSYLGTARDAQDLETLLACPLHAAFDLDTYRILTRYFRTHDKPDLIQLT